MSVPKTAYSSNGIVHFSVGALIKKDNKFLLIDRATPPNGFSCIAGHIDMNESPEQALQRELKEESGLDLVNFNLIAEETLQDNWCNRGVKNHHWYIFECEVRGHERKNNEAKSIGWYSQSEIQKMTLEPTWNHFLKKFKII